MSWPIAARAAGSQDQQGRRGQTSVHPVVWHLTTGWTWRGRCAAAAALSLVARPAAAAAALAGHPEFVMPQASSRVPARSEVSRMIALRSLRRLLSAVFLLTPTLARAQGGSKAIAEVRAARLAQNAVLAAHQMDSAASFWVNDVVITAGLGRVLRGKDAYRQAFALDSGMVYVRTPAHIDVATPWLSAWEEGEWVGRQGPSGPIVIRGRYAAQWHRVGTRWLIRSEVFVALACSGAACRWPLATL